MSMFVVILCIFLLSQGIFLVYDITNENTFLSLQKWMACIREVSYPETLEVLRWPVYER